jgi:hypothetical protein
MNKKNHNTIACAQKTQEGTMRFVKGVTVGIGTKLRRAERLTFRLRHVSDFGRAAKQPPKMKSAQERENRR